jgi:hypothetical protein
MTTSEPVSSPWCDENDTALTEGDWVLTYDLRGRIVIERVNELAYDDGAPFLALANGDDPSPSETTKVVPYPAGAEEPDWFHDPIGGRWVGPVGDGTVFVEIFADELASLTAAVAEATEGDDGQHAMLDIDALGGPKMLRETMCVAQGAVLREGHAGAQLHADRIASIIDVCDQHRPLGPDGKHGTRRCTPTCGCIDKRDPEPDDGLIPVTDPEPVEGPPGTVPVTLWLTAQEVSGEGEGWDSAVDKLCDACAAIDLPAPKPPWKSPLADLPDLTEEQCCDAVRIAGEGPDSPVMWAQVGRALIAAGWTQGEEA